MSEPSKSRSQTGSYQLEIDTFALKPHIQRGDAAPWWKHEAHKFAFDSVAGKYIVLGFFGHHHDPIGKRLFPHTEEYLDILDTEHSVLFLISYDSFEPTTLQLGNKFKKVIFLRDDDGSMHRAYGIGPNRLWIVLDPMLRVLEVIPIQEGRDNAERLRALLKELPPPQSYLGLEATAPVLALPNVFEPEFCAHLISCYEAHGATESGFMQEFGGRTAEVHDPLWKRRRDFNITDQRLIELIKARLGRRVGLMLHRAFHFRLSRIERYLVACYDSEEGGHFGPHRDDTVKSTEHRRFAASIGLNSGFEGGELIFPEFGSQRFTPPIGGALIFSASLLHRVTKVTRGRRYVFLPFFHDEDAERIRVANLKDLAAD